MRTVLRFAVLACFVGSPVLMGCDKTVSEDKTVKQNSDGTTEVKHDKTVEKPDGSMEKTTEHQVSK